MGSILFVEHQIEINALDQGSRHWDFGDIIASDQLRLGLVFRSVDNGFASFLFINRQSVRLLAWYPVMFDPFEWG